MEETNPLPRKKKLKTQHHTDGAMDQDAPVPNQPMADAPSISAGQAALQLDKEVQCGITDFIHAEHQAFTGILKKRYTDFLVNEILPSGQVVHLDDFSAPRARKDDAANRSPVKVKPAAPGNLEAQSTDPPPRVQAELEPVNRTKHKVIIRETDEGIEEIQKDEKEVGNKQSSEKQNAPAQPAEDAIEGKPERGTERKVGQTSEEPKKENVPSTTSDWNTYAGRPARFELSSEDREILTAYFPSQVVEEILALYNGILHSPNRRAKEYGSVKSAAITDRTMRTKIHQDLRRIFQSRLESMTDNDGAMVICAMSEKPQWGSRQPNTNGQAQRPQQNRRLQWKELGGDYLHFTLYKENKDTMEAIAWISKQLKLPPKSFQFAGTKDRRGVTVQRISVYRVLADKMIGAGRTLRQAKIGNYEYRAHELRLGDLVGNEFVITLRDCQFPSSEDDDIKERLNRAFATVDTCVKSLNEKGFINYYGLQRFGTFTTRTDTVGVKMLQGDFKGAVDAILDFNPALLESAQGSTSSYDKVAADDRERASAIREFRLTGKSHSALQILPRKFSAESSIIRHLSGNNQNNDYQGALNTIPRNLRLMYVHAYQSLVWNVMAGLRWKEHGNRVVEGDLVLVRELTDKIDPPEKPAEVDADGEVIVQPDEEDRAANVDNLFERARALSKEEADSGKYTIFNIVLPTPGYDILYPANEMAEHYKSLMASDRGGGLDPYDMRRSWKDISLSGSYRKVLARPMGKVTFDVKSYSGDDEQFTKTDLEKMSEEGKYTNRRQAPASAEDRDQAEAPEVPVDDKIAVILKLQLSSSQYATMALRELMGPGGLQTYKPDYGGGR